MNSRTLRAGRLQLRSRAIEFAPWPVLMGIINVTPDSFSDGGRYFDPRAAIARGVQLAAEGAALLDVGGESTRPYSDPVSPEEELRRVVPVIRGLTRQLKVPISVDTSKAIVARAAIDAGAEMINDVTALTGDPAMIALARETGVGLCAMHMQGTPQTMQNNPTYTNVLAEVTQFLLHRRDTLEAAGISRNRICLDPGIGFGKTHEQNLELMRRAGDLHSLGCPLLVGHSRKGFLGKLIGSNEADRSNATLGAALALARQGIQILRVHDVGPLREALAAYWACGGASTAGEASCDARNLG